MSGADEQYHDGDGNPCSLEEAVRREPEWAANCIRGLRTQLHTLLREAEAVASLTYEIKHKGSGPPSDYDPDIYELQRVTSIGWWRFVHAVRDALKETT